MRSTWCPIIRRFGFSRASTYIAVATGIAMLALCFQWTSGDAALRDLSATGPAAAGTVSNGCPGDCGEDGQVTVEEILRIVDIILGTSPLGSCPVLTEVPTIQDVIRAVNAALSGCPPSPTPMPTDTPMPTPTPIKYHLVEGSLIRYQPPPTNGTPASTAQEPISGSFTLDHLINIPQFALLEVTTVEFHSAHFAVVGQSSNQAGYVQIALPDAFFMCLAVSINGQAIRLAGQTIVSCCSSSPPPLDGLEICGAPGQDLVSCEAIPADGYALTIFAVPE